MPGETNNEEKDIEMIKSINSYPMEVGEKWYLVNIKWFRKWCEYVGYNEADGTTTTPGHSASLPEKIDNTPLFTDYNKTTLKEEISDDQDYKLLPEPVWKYVNEKYGVHSPSDVIERRVINDSQTNNSFARVEIKFPIIKCECIHDDRSTSLEFKDISRATPLPELVQKIRDRFQISSNKKVRLYMKTADLQVTLIDYEDESKSKETYTTLGVGPEDKLCLLIQSENSSWPITTLENRPSSGARATSISNRDNSPVRSTMTTRSAKSNEYSFSSRFNDSKPGLCGLSNLGNTCFMNSAIQCMSNVPILTHYFLTGQYKHEINTVNPLGRKGDFANAYAELIDEMWNGRNSYTVPRAFKTHISRFAPQFTGYQQQDSQELLAYMLDGLHEDLNRIKTKPYIESGDEAGKSDEQLAQETWENYRKRNDSKIVDTFHGLIKSTLNCLECNQISIKFDPICYLSLPLPSKKERLIDVYYVALNQKEPLVKYKLNVLKNGTISDLLNVLSQYINVPKQQLIACDVYSNKFFHVYETHEPVNNIRERDDIYIYEMPYNINSEEHIKFQFYLKEKMSYSTYFGLPLMLSVPKKDLSPDSVYKTIVQSLKRFIVNSDGIIDADVHEIHSKLNSASFFNDDDDEKSKKICNLYLSKSDQYDYNNSNPLLDSNSINNLLKTSQNQVYTIIGEFTSKMKDTHYVSRINPTEHESCNAKLVAKKDLLELDECFNLFTKKEELSDSDLWYCPKCKKHQHATKQIDLWSSAQVLVIHLKRFSYSRIFRDKIDTLVDFPVRDLELKKFIKDPKNKNQTKYNLIAISNHYGGLGGGHYTAYAQNCEDGHWYNFDDSSVSSIDESSIVTPAAYLLVYLRQDLHAKYLKKPLKSISNGRQEELMDTN